MKHNNPSGPGRHLADRERKPLCGDDSGWHIVTPRRGATTCIRCHIISDVATQGQLNK